ncbi:MAG: response regulator transcription factor [Actinomycetes bacterium]|jgi:DNA-binding NarL/FixJ family response regulator
MKIAIIDDHSLIRSGVTAALANSNYEVVAEASSVEEGLAVINSLKPDICLIDINLGSGNGIDLIKKSLSNGGKSKFVILSMHDDLATLDLAKQAGASGYLTKGAPIEQLLEILDVVATDSGKFIKKGQFQKALENKDFGLTPRELEVLSLLPTGATAVALGGILFLTEATIKTHLASIYRKLGAANRAQAVSIGIENKLIAN